jgi:hypothetical protein
MKQYWLYASPMPHTLVNQTVEDTSNISSKYFNFRDKNDTIRRSKWAAGDRRVDLNSIAMILFAWDVGLEIFKQNTRSIKSRN